MRTLAHCLIGLVVCGGAYAGCAAGAGSTGSSVAGSGGSLGVTGPTTTGAGGSPTTTSTTATTATGLGSGGSTSGTGGSGPACAKFTSEAKEAPAALLVVLQASASMNDSGKWGTAQSAVTSALDKDVFDSMSLGMVVFPSNFVDMPQCLVTAECMGLAQTPADCQSLLMIPGVSCGVSALPQIPMAAAGTNKSNAGMGVRHDIYDYLVSSPSTNHPLSNADNGSPIYDALVSGYKALAAYSINQRILVLVTDGGGSCASLSSPTRPGYSDGACPDWEYPTTVNTLIKAAHDDPNTPVRTFIVGLPGSNTNGGMSPSGFANAPYDMLLALSTYAVSGSPETIDPACSKSAVFTQGGGSPAAPCHIDLSNGAAFNPGALATAIAQVRGKALGCVYDLPPAPQGQTIDPAKVNVIATVNGQMGTIPRRKSPSNTCLASPCWDYNAKKQVELIGLACSAISTATMAKVDIEVGCDTILK